MRDEQRRLRVSILAAGGADFPEGACQAVVGRIGEGKIIFLGNVVVLVLQAAAHILNALENLLLDIEQQRGVHGIMAATPAVIQKHA